MIVRWARQWGSSDHIVWVNVSALNKAWKLDRGFYIAMRDGHRLYKYQRFGRWLASHARTRVHMPHIDLHNCAVCFTDGRHRFAWMRDHGVQVMPITVATKGDARRIAESFGTSSRLSFART